MKNKIISVIAVFFALIILGAKNVAAYDREELEKEVSDIFTYEMKEAGVSDINEYLTTGLVPLAGHGGEWLVINMYNAGYEADYELYFDALDEYLRENPDLKNTDYERIGLALKCFGKDYSFSIEYGGIMSIIYGLMLYEDYELAESLIDLQLEDGGFALYGSIADVDVTAMALRALSFDKEKYKKSIDSALNRLSLLQREDGGFASYGQDNAESSAQVLMALTALDIDFEQDERFIKNSNTVLDAMKTYKNPDGGYAHIRGSSSNAMATCQVLEAYLGITGKIWQNNDVREPLEEKNITGNVVKFAIILIIGAIAAILLIAGAVKKKNTLKRTLCILVLSGAAMGTVCLLKIQMPWEHYSLPENGEVKTTIEITGADGNIINEMTVYINEGDTAFEQLQNAVAKEEIVINYTGNNLMKNIYISSIDGLSEFDYGPMSGWKYTVNGEYPDKSCADVSLKDGDEVKWIYVKE